MQANAIADIHCDMLWYLSLDGHRTPCDLEVRCALPQMRAGNVKVQAMAIFAETGAPASTQNGWMQADVFMNLPKRYPEEYVFFRHSGEYENLLRGKHIGIVPAVENASAICSEIDNLDLSLKRLTEWQEAVGKLIYVSLTWNSENRFGGGAWTTVGLKDDGKKLLEYLAMTGVAVDFSHASDRLAYDVLDYIDREKLPIAVMASHSNMRAVTEHARNLPDDIAREIIRRGGLIGLNFVRYFLGSDSTDSFARQVDHILSLGGGRSICFGADFFCNSDMPEHLRKPDDVVFFPGYDTAGSYPKVLEIVRRHLGLSAEAVADLCYNNFIRFLSTKSANS